MAYTATLPYSLGILRSNNITDSPITLTVDQCNNMVNYVLNSADTTINLPSVDSCTVGSYFIVYMTTNYIVTIAPYSSDRIILNGDALGDGVTIISGGYAGNLIYLQNDGINGWTCIGRSGLWNQSS
jgi:hypothetical protein